MHYCMNSKGFLKKCFLNKNKKTPLYIHSQSSKNEKIKNDIKNIKLNVGGGQFEKKYMGWLK